ncbi:MAG: hypothetical protein AAF704_05420 [Cyanobacteria bacterium P01_D01_bin.123]
MFYQVANSFKVFGLTILAGAAFALTACEPTDTETPDAPLEDSGETIPESFPPSSE